MLIQVNTFARTQLQFNPYVLILAFFLFFILVKGTMPLFTVILSRLILGEKQTFKASIYYKDLNIQIQIANRRRLSWADFQKRRQISNCF